MQVQAPAFEVSKTGFDGEGFVIVEFGLSFGRTIGNEKEVLLFGLMLSNKDVELFDRITLDERELGKKTCFTGGRPSSAMTCVRDSH